MSITDNLFNPVETFGHRMGTAVKWTNLGPSSHKVKDSTGLGLFSSPSIPIGGTYQYTFIAACIFKYEDPGHSGMTGTVKSQVDIEPFSGTTSTTFTITWASQSAPSGFVYDVQIQRPGESSYSTWKNGVTGKSATFKPDSGTGNYRFQARMRSTSSGKSCNYSPYRQVAVS